MTTPTITISSPRDINWGSLVAVIDDNARVIIDEPLLHQVDTARRDFFRLIEKGVPCYGVTTGLGQLSSQQLSAADIKDMSSNVLRGRAAAIGPPFNRSTARSMLLIRLVNFLSCYDGVSADLCRYLADRLNDDFVPWVPSLGHGMAADAIANTHAFQTLIGEGYVLDKNGARQPAFDALSERGVAPYSLREKEGLALINGIVAAPALAFDVRQHLAHTLRLANTVAAVAVEAMAAPKDAFDPALKTVDVNPGVREVLDTIERLFDQSEIQAKDLQAPISYRVIPQVHGALHAALDAIRTCIERDLVRFSGNPMLVLDDTEIGGRFLSVGLFHNQHLVIQIEHAAIALAHVGCLSERRLHRLMDPAKSGLPPQLAGRPGLDAGLVTAHKATIDLTARLRQLAQPLSLFTGDSSAGQEDYMSLAVPVIARLKEMAILAELIFAYELLAGLVALDQRDHQPGLGVAAVREHFSPLIAPLHQDRSLGPDVEIIVSEIRSQKFTDLLKRINIST